MGVIRYTFYSKTLGEQTNICAIVPTYEGWRDKMDYKDYYKEYGKKRLLFIMHGGSDDSTLYLRRTRIEEYAYERNMVVIFPEVRNSFYSNMVHGKKYFDYISKELPEMVMNMFPVSRERKDHFVLGNSMGSHGSFKFALNCPEFFAAATGMSGAGDLEELGFYSPMSVRVNNSFGTIEEYRGSRNDFKHLYREMLKNGTEFPRLYACCGTEDGFYPGAKKFAEDAKAAGVPIEWYESPGKHEWVYWDSMLPMMLDKMIEGV